MLPKHNSEAFLWYTFLDERGDYMEYLYSILVVYNQPISESISYRALKRNPDLQIIVCDNSTRDYGNKEAVEADGQTYINMGGNVGLAKAYNRALDYIVSVNPKLKGYVIIFDDDTEIPDDYFEKLYTYLESGTADIYLPIVDAGDRRISPSSIHNSRCHEEKDSWNIPSDRLCGINSGMTIRLALFKDYRYNEDMFLDFVDHDFIRSMHVRKAFMRVMDITLHQNLSTMNDNLEAAIKRFQIHRKDVDIFYRGNLNRRILYHYYMLRLKMEFVQYQKDIRVFWKY